MIQAAEQKRKKDSRILAFIQSAVCLCAGPMTRAFLPGNISSETITDCSLVEADGQCGEWNRRPGVLSSAARLLWSADGKSSGGGLRFLRLQRPPETEQVSHCKKKCWTQSFFFLEQIRSVRFDFSSYRLTQTATTEISQTFIWCHLVTRVFPKFK